mmetsp:Transcript_67161/g.194190  ORF Transcript_67161/g.194190 Transcript_67161/m.194190 type:complete len:217 (+) Transcript_67161:967-1617(+)
MALRTQRVELPVEVDQLARQWPTCHQLEQVAPIVPTRKGDPFRNGADAVAPQQRGCRQPPGQHIWIQPLDGVPREVHTGGVQEGDGLRRVPLLAQVEPQVKRPCASARSVGAADRDAQLDRPEAVHIRSQRPVPHRRRGPRAVLAQEPWKFGVQSKYRRRFPCYRIQQFVELRVEVPSPDLTWQPRPGRRVHPAAHRVNVGGVAPTTSGGRTARRG